MNRPCSTYSPEVLKRCASMRLKCAPGLFGVQEKRRFRSLFGVTPVVCSIVWQHIARNLPDFSMPYHLLWGLMFLKVYASESVHALIAEAGEKTFRKWARTFVIQLSSIQLVCLTERYTGELQFPDSDVHCYMSVDGVDVSIQEPQTFSSKWYSHKLKGAGLRYEVAVSINEGSIVWGNGPFECGMYSDIKLFGSNLKQRLQHNELVVADEGYQNEKCY